MTGPDYNPDDLEFLISREIDGDLSDDEQRLLNEQLVASPELRAEADRLRSIARIVSRWGQAQPAIDWTPHAKLVQAHLTESREEADDRLDHMLRGWAAEGPAVDEGVVFAGVMSQIGAGSPMQAKRRGRRGLYPLLRIGAPLAAAAVLAFSLSTFLWTGPQAAAPVVVVEIGRASTLQPVAEKGYAVVSFARETTIVGRQVEGSSIAFLTLGSAPANPNTESAPL